MRYLRKINGLNQVEQWKLERHPLDVRDAVLDRYAREGPEAIKTVPGEAERLKWVGLYPQRQGGDAFMLRVKVPGGRLRADQARVIGQLAPAGQIAAAGGGDRLGPRRLVALVLLGVADVGLDDDVGRQVRAPCRRRARR